MGETTKFLLIIGFMVLLSAITAGVYIPALPEMEQIFHVSAQSIKLSITLYFIGAMVGAILVKPFAIKYGYERTLRIFIVVFLGGTLLCVLSLSMLPFFVGRFIQGVGIIVGPVIGLAFVADRFERARYRQIIAFILVLLGVGTGLSHLIGIAVMLVLHWEYIFYLLFLLGFFAIGISYFLPQIPLLAPERHRQAKYRDQYKEHSGLFIYYQGMIGALEGALYAFLIISPYILRVRYGWTLYEFSVLGGSVACAGILGAYLNIKLRSLLGIRGTVLLGLYILLLVFVFLFFLDGFFSPVWLVANIALFALGSGFILENLVSQVLKYFPRLTKLSSGLIVSSKIGACALVVGLVLIFPESEATIAFFVLFAFLICVYGYIKVRGKLFPPKRSTD